MVIEHIGGRYCLGFGQVRQNGKCARPKTPGRLSQIITWAGAVILTSSEAIPLVLQTSLPWTDSLGEIRGGYIATGGLMEEHVFRISLFLVLDFQHIPYNLWPLFLPRMMQKGKEKYNQAPILKFCAADNKRIFALTPVQVEFLSSEKPVINLTKFVAVKIPNFNSDCVKIQVTC